VGAEDITARAKRVQKGVGAGFLERVVDSKKIGKFYYFTFCEKGRRTELFFV